MCPTMSHLNALQPKLDEDLVLIQTLSGSPQYDGEHIELCANEDDGGHERTTKNQEEHKGTEKTPKTTETRKMRTTSRPLHTFETSLDID